MHKCKPKFTLLLPVDMNGLTGVEEREEMKNTAIGPTPKSK